MAIAEITSTCQFCGTEFRKVMTCRNRNTANEWEAWAQRTMSICPTCWAKQKANDEREEGLIAHIRPILDDSELVGLYSIVLFGPTYPLRKELRGHGFLWNNQYPANPPVRDLLAGQTLCTRPQKKRWYKICPEVNLNREIGVLDSLGFRCIDVPTEEAAIGEIALRAKA